MRGTSDRDVRRGLVLVKKKHRSVTTNIVLPDIFFRCDTNKGNYASFLCDKTQKKRPRYTMAFGSSMFFFSSDRRASKDAHPWTVQSAIEYAESAFFVYSTLLVFSCFFLHFGRMPIEFFFFAKCVAGLNAP